MKVGTLIDRIAGAMLAAVVVHQLISLATELTR